MNDIIENTTGKVTEEDLKSLYKMQEAVMGLDKTQELLKNVSDEDAKKAIDNMSEKEIDEAYDKLMSIGKTLNDAKLTEEDIKTSHDRLVEEITGVKIDAVGQSVKGKTAKVVIPVVAPALMMTNEDAANVAKKMEECVEDDATTQFIKGLPSNNGVTTHSMDEKEEDIDPQVALTTTNPESGAAIVHGIVGEDFEEKDIDFDFDKYLNMDDYSLEKLEFTREVFTDDILDTFRIKKSEVDTVVNVINRVKSGEEFNIYNELPQSLRMLVDNLTAANAQAGNSTHTANKNGAARDVINSIATEVGADKYQYDLEALLHRHMQSTTSNVVQEAYTDLITSKKKQMYDTAEKVEQVDAEKAATLRAIGDACEESYKLDKFYEALKNHKIKIKKYEVERPDKVFRNFCYKYTDSAMCINQISDITIAIPRHLGSTEKECRATGKTIDALAVAFCKYCMNMSPNVPQEHAFMYYFIKNILALDVTIPGEECIKFDMELIDRIKDLLNVIADDYNIK